MLDQILRYCAVGITNTAVGLLSIFGAHFAFGLSDVAANAIGYAIGLMFSFFVNRSWTFQNRTSVGVDILPFISLATAGYCANLVALVLLRRVFGMNFYLAQICAVVIYSAIMFIGLRYWTEHGLEVSGQVRRLLSGFRSRPFEVPSLCARIIALGTTIAAVCWYRLLLAVLTAVFFFAGTTVWFKNSGSAEFYQTEFTPAITFACTGKMMNIYGERPAALSAFLERRTNSLKCDDVFPLTPKSSLGVLNVHQAQTLGFLYGYGLLWKVFWFSWNVSLLFAGAFLALYFLGLSMIGRLFVPAVPSALSAAGIVALDTGGLGFLIHLRDFSKAPFILLLVYLVITMWDKVGRRLIAASGLTALVLALGLGFRSDVFLFFPIISVLLVAKIAFQPGNRVASLGAFASFLAVLALFQILAFDYSQGVGRNVYHFYFLGQTERFQQELGLGHASYMLGYLYNDHVAHQLTSLFTQATSGGVPVYGSAEYDRAGRAQFLLHLWQFPADAASRALSAGVSALFGGSSANPISQALLALGASCILIRAKGARAAAALALIFFLSAITFIQFDLRHYFVYRPIGLMLIVVVIYWVLALLLILWGGKSNERLNWAGFGETSAPLIGARLRWRWLLTAAPLIVAGVLVALLPVLRAYQTRVLERTLDELAHAPIDPVGLVRDQIAAEPGLVRPALGKGDASRYARLSFDTARADCQRAPVLALRYSAPSQFHDWSHEVRAPTGGVSTVYVPVLQSIHNTFNGLTLSQADASCLTRFEFIKLPPGIIPQTYFVHSRAHAANSWFESSIERSFSHLLKTAKFRAAPHRCGERSPVLRGGDEPFAYKNQVKVHRYIRFIVDDGDANVASDHANIVAPVLTVDGQAWQVEQFALEEVRLSMFRFEVGRNILRRPLKLRGVMYENGFGVHAPAQVILAIPPQLIGKSGVLSFGFGVDDQTAGAGSVAITVCWIG